MYVPLYFLFGMEAKIFENRDQCNHKNAQLHRYSLVLSLENGKKLPFSAWLCVCHKKEAFGKVSVSDNN